jgi:hypothetical protein
MALTEETVVDQITVLEDEQIQVRRATIVLRDGAEISRTYHRHVVAPGDDVSAEDVRVRDVATLVHTDAAIAAYRAAVAARPVREA